MNRVQCGVFVCLSALLSLTASACEFPTVTPTTVDNVIAGVLGTTEGIHRTRDVDRRPAGTLDDDPPPLQATPELDSLALFGSGLLGAGAYLRLRMRAARRK